jgi:hypothetical protein
MIGRDVLKRECGRAVALCGVQPLLSPFDKENLCGKPRYGGADYDSELLRLSMATLLVSSLHLALLRARLTTPAPRCG